MKERPARKRKKISPVDWIQALKFSKEYAKDYKIYEEESKDQPDDADKIVCYPNIPGRMDGVFIRSAAAEKLCRKYGLRFPIDPSTPYEEYELTYLPAPVDILIPRELQEYLMRAFPSGECELSEVIEELNDYFRGRVTVMINPMFSRDQIRSNFQKILDYYGEKSKEKLKINQVDIWKAYKMHEIDEVPFEQIAVKLLQSGGKHAYDAEDDRKLKLVKRAYNKACRIIKKVESLVNFENSYSDYIPSSWEHTEIKGDFIITRSYEVKDFSTRLIKTTKIPI